MKIFINIVVTLLCTPWPAIIMMSPMMIAAKDFAGSKSAIITAMLFFTYPAFVFLIVKLSGASFYGTNPAWWALSVFITGSLVSMAYGLPGKLTNLYQGISNEGYFIHKNNVYLNGARISGADAKTFIHYNDLSYYSKDKNYVYHNTQKLAEADAETFGPLAGDENKHYWHDKNNAYYRWKKIANADGGSLKYLGHRYTCDKNHVFYEDQLVEGADVTTFKSMEGSVGRDTNNIFVHAIRATNIKDFPSFKMVQLNEEWFGKDKEQVYVLRYKPPHPLLPFPGADPKTFEVVGDYYAKDKKHVYYYSYHIEQIVVLEGANPETFRLNFDSEKNTDATDGQKHYKYGQVPVE